MVATGLLVDSDNHAEQLVGFGKAMLRVASTVPDRMGGWIQIRVGIHSGKVMSGIVGSLRARYCL